jgi:hypothetical protein
MAHDAVLPETLDILVEALHGHLPGEPDPFPQHLSACRSRLLSIDMSQQAA